MASDSSGTFETDMVFDQVPLNPDTPYNGFYGATPFSRFPLLTAQTIHYKSAGSGNPLKMYLNGYTF